MDYALCGGLAMAVYGTPRATVDIDLLVPPAALEEAMEAARQRGYAVEAAPMTFADGAIRIRRLTKLDPESEDLLTLDLLVVTPQIADVWEARRQVAWDDGTLSVVSRKGLTALKRLRGSDQDIADIERLSEKDTDGD
ncbi:MAG: nucleotidyl transferase AbiEii/AbiGii toxin family protein [Planctomycetota bacterium]